MFYSADAISWTQATLYGSSSSLYAIAYGGGFDGRKSFIALGYLNGAQDRILGSVGPSPAVFAPFPTTGVTNEHFFDVAGGNGQFVILNNQSAVLTCTNVSFLSTQWSKQTLSANGRLRRVFFGDSTFVAVGDAGSLFTSADGTNWQQRDSGVTNDLRAAAFTPDAVFLFGSDDIVLKSAPLASFQIDASRNLVFQGLRGRSFHIQWSTVLGTNVKWWDLTNLVLTGDSLVWPDDSAKDFRSRFYRAAPSPLSTNQ